MRTDSSMRVNHHRRQFIGGSDARIIMGDDEAALLRLWREKRGEVEPEDLTANLIVQLGVVTEHLNRHLSAHKWQHFDSEGTRRYSKSPVSPTG
jgi:predicted phage-related endonuclease